MQHKSGDLNDDLLWSRYWGQSDVATRDLIIEHYSSLVKVVAASLYAQRPDDEVEFDEFFQYGMVGLIESVDRYEPDKGASFRTFATYRIRGAILNGLEKITERHEQRAYLGRLRKERLASITATDDKRNDISLFEEMTEVALGLAICYMLEDTGLVQDPANASGDQAYQAKELLFLKASLIESVDFLPERERLIIHSHYFQHSNFNDIAEMLGVTKGRVSQLHKRALLQLREKLGGGLSLNECF